MNSILLYSQNFQLFRYLATGSSFKCLAQYFMRGHRTIGLVVAETTNAIWKCLQPLYMPVPDENMWKYNAQSYQQLWSLPNCIGSIDGKHVKIRKFKNSGSTNFNFKGYNSVQLMACADADGCFTTIDVGDLGRNSDGGVFRSSRLGRWLDRGELNLPPPQPLPFDGNQISFPFFFVGDEAFPLKTYLMRPYPRADLTDEKRIFNFRLTLGRKTVECAFGMLTSKFRVFEVPIACSEKVVKSIIASACVLHNYIRKSEGVPYTPNNTFSDIEASHENQHLRVDANTNLTSAKAIREYLTKYFLKPGIAIPSQWHLIHDNISN